MHDGRDALIRRGAELADWSRRTCSAAAELKAQSQELVWRLAETQKTGARVLGRLTERPDVPHPGLADIARPPGHDGPGADHLPASIRSPSQAPHPAVAFTRLCEGRAC